MRPLHSRPAQLTASRSVPVDPARAWSKEDARIARLRYEARNQRVALPSTQAPSKPTAVDDRVKKSSVIEQALARARARTPIPPSNREKRTEIFSRLQAANPQPTTELEYANPFQLLIAVLLSAQATDKSVNQATRKLFADHPTAQDMLALGEAKLAEYIRTIGLYKTKAKNVLATCDILVNHYKGEIPQTREELEALPGVGRKTANVVLNTAFGQPTIAVDTHIFRVSNRTRIAPGKDVLQVEKALEKFIPEPFKLNAHHWLILHGRYVCVARKPKCPQCGISDLCEYKPKTKP